MKANVSHIFRRDECWASNRHRKRGATWLFVQSSLQKEGGGMFCALPVPLSKMRRNVRKDVPYRFIAFLPYQENFFKSVYREGQLWEYFCFCNLLRSFEQRFGVGGLNFHWARAAMPGHVKRILKA